MATSANAWTMVVSWSLMVPALRPNRCRAPITSPASATGTRAPSGSPRPRPASPRARTGNRQESHLSPRSPTLVERPSRDPAGLAHSGGMQRLLKLSV